MGMGGTSPFVFPGGGKMEMILIGIPWQFPKIPGVYDRKMRKIRR